MKASKRGNRPILWAALLVLALPVQAIAVAAHSVGGEPPFSALEREEIERFLRTARVIEVEPIPVGITRPERVTLSDGERTARAVWKTVHIYEPIQRFKNGRVQLSFRDSYKHEIAAYELDKLLGLDMVPPTVERRLFGKTGSLQLWIEGAMMETERMERALPIPDPEDWNRQIYTLRLVRQLFDDSDYNNISNILLDADFRVWAIDHSRAFRLGRKLRRPEALRLFSRSLLDGMRGADSEVLYERLEPWLTKRQIRMLLLRRDLVLELANRLVAEKGEAAVLCDGSRVGTTEPLMQPLEAPAVSPGGQPECPGYPEWDHPHQACVSPVQCLFAARARRSQRELWKQEGGHK